ncbi:MAG: long-chain-fatty-acid--CoA ligase [Candidatus Thermoplasmatota archaeon]|jgi:fatty-acyl-CoA synthase|nr:long-chain-fatty-acid--CoA ligase [Candidatus Thermoplasmatota archaeon]MCL5987964.1 long-chain-fatty-acid--CoA ligase [Candidatus Thermoplasmatota archaeon]
MTYIPYELTVGNLLSSSVKRNPEQVIVDPQYGSFTYREFEKNVEKFAKGLIRVGVRHGDRVAVLDWDTIHYLEAFYAIPMCGAAIHTVNIRYPNELIYYTMNHAEDSYVILREDIAKQLSSYGELFGFVKGWVIYGSSPEKKDLPFENVFYLDDMMKEDDNTSLPSVSENDIATIFYTSGSTGMPKGITFRHRDLVMLAYNVGIMITDEPLNAKSSDVIMPIVPMFHVHAWGMPFACIMRGSKYVLAGRYHPETIVSIMGKEKVTLSLMVPSILHMLLSAKNAPEILPERNLRVVVGGAAITSALRDSARKMNIEAVAGYGLSETAPILSIAVYNQLSGKLPKDEKDKLPLKAGTIAPMVEIRIIDINGTNVTDSHQTGEITARGPYLASEYYKDPEATKKLWKDGWLHTGDLGFIDEYGYLNIVDREKDSVKSGGEFIPTLILEDVISLFGRVKEVAVIGKKDEKWGERPVAFYTSDQEIDPKEITEFLSKFVQQRRIEKFWIPDEFIKIDSFVKGYTGKIDKKALRAMIGQDN